MRFSKTSAHHNHRSLTCADSHLVFPSSVGQVPSKFLESENFGVIATLHLSIKPLEIKKMAFMRKSEARLFHFVIKSNSHNTTINCQGQVASGGDSREGSGHRVAVFYLVFGTGSHYLHPKCWDYRHDHTEQMAGSCMCSICVCADVCVLCLGGGRARNQCHLSFSISLHLIISRQGLSLNLQPAIWLDWLPASPRTLVSTFQGRLPYLVFHTGAQVCRLRIKHCPLSPAPQTPMTTLMMARLFKNIF